jgi:hypothetical protein
MHIMAVQRSFAYASILYLLRQMLPTKGQTLLLQACLDAENGLTAWATWRSAYDLKATLATDTVGVKGLLPYLAYALEQNGDAAGSLTSDDLTLLRMARYRESLRFERYQAILQQALTALAEGGVKAILLKGATLALTVYPHPALRHCHDIDLLIHSGDLHLAAQALCTHSFAEPSQQPSPLERGDLRLDHASRLPVVLHTTLVRNHLFAMPVDGAWQCALPLAYELPALMLAPEWELVHLLGAMLCAPRRARVTWVCDAHLLLVANPALDWERVCDIAADSGLALPAFVLLDYLRQEHHSPVPAFVSDRLQQYFAAIDRTGYEQILHCGRLQNAAGYGKLLANAASWQERAFLWRWMIFSLPTTVQRRKL